MQSQVLCRRVKRLLLHPKWARNLCFSLCHSMTAFPLPDSTTAEDILTSLASALPGDVMLEIMCRLPVKSLLRFKCVSQSWYSVVKNLFFINKHNDHWSKVRRCGLAVLGHDRKSKLGIINTRVGSTIILPMGLRETYTEELAEGSVKWEPIGIIEKDSVTVVGVSNGLICLTPDNSSQYGCGFFVVNPALREHKRIRIKLFYEREPEKYDLVSVGFGFDHKDDDFKIVRIEQFNDDSGVCRPSRVNVYSLYTNSWKSTKNMVNVRLTSPVAEYSCNFMYWISDGGKEITVLDLFNERFYCIPIPGSVESLCNEIHSWKKGIFIYIYEPDGNSFEWIWSPENPTWEIVGPVSLEMLDDLSDKLKSAFTDHFPEHRYLIPAWLYEESLIPVNRVDKFIFNVIPRLENTFSIRFIEEVLEIPEEKFVRRNIFSSF